MPCKSELQHNGVGHKTGTKPGFRPLVYICAPFSGDIPKNTDRAADFAAFAYRRGCIPLTAHLLFPFMDDTDEQERETALLMDLVLMGKCEEVWVLSGNISHGMNREIQRAKRRKQRIRFFDDQYMEVTPS